MDKIESVVSIKEIRFEKYSYFFFQNVSKMQHQSNLFWKIPNIKIRIYYQFFSNFNKHCYQNRLFLKHEPWKMTNVVLFILMNFWYFPQFLPHFAALDLLRQNLHPQICRLPRQAANMTYICPTCGVLLFLILAYCVWYYRYLVIICLH